MANDLDDKYRMVFDYHTHTTYSHGFPTPHGKGTVADNVYQAKRTGLRGIAISDHGPGHLFYGIRPAKIESLRRDIEEQKKIYKDLDIYMSVEANIIESPSGLDVDANLAKSFDFLIAGYHYGVKHGHVMRNYLGAMKNRQGSGDNGLLDPEGHPIDTDKTYEKMRNLNTEMYLNALENSDIKILTHPGDKAPVDIVEVAKACAKNGTWMEISTWHMHLTINEIKLAMKEDVEFVISSDAHTPERVGSFAGGLERALAAGLDPERIVNIERI